MSEILRLGDPEIVVRLRRSSRARRFILRVPPHGPDGAILTLPEGASRAAAIAFLARTEPWLRERLSATGGRRSVRDGASIPFGDTALAIRARTTPGRLEASGGTLWVPGSARNLPGKVRGFLIESARAALVARTGLHARRIGRRPGRITLRDTRSRWGSCTSEGNLMFSWRLVMAPAGVLDYVAAHEVAHLAEMNHSPRFWSIVRDLRPDYETQRDWLRRSGASLHRYDFATP